MTIEKNKKMDRRKEMRWPAVMRSFNRVKKKIQTGPSDRMSGFPHVKANYNMVFDKGSFIKDRIYQYHRVNNSFYVVAEENTEQDFSFQEFDLLFSLIS